MMSLPPLITGMGELIALPPPVASNSEGGTAFAQLLMTSAGSNDAEAREPMTGDIEAAPEANISQTTRVAGLPIEFLSIGSALRLVEQIEAPSPEGEPKSATQLPSLEDQSRQTQLPASADVIASSLDSRFAELGTAQILPPPPTASSDPIGKLTKRTERSASKTVDAVVRGLQPAAITLDLTDMSAFSNGARPTATGDTIGSSPIDADPTAKLAMNLTTVDATHNSAAPQPSQSFELAKPIVAFGNSMEIAAPFATADARAVETLQVAAYFDALAGDIMAANSSQSRTSFCISTDKLGILGIGVDPSPTGILVHITAQHDDAGAIIAAAQPRLHEELRAQGVRVSEQSEPSFDRQQSHDRARQQQHRHGHPDPVPARPDNQPVARRSAPSYRFA